MRHLPINNQLFKANRKRFINRLSAKATAVFLSNDEYPRNGDQFFRFGQCP